MKPNPWLIALVLIMAACTTTGKFKIPAGSNLYVYNRPVPVEVPEDGTVTTRPFHWPAAFPTGLRKMARRSRKAT